MGALGKMDVPSEDVDKFNKPTYIVFGEKGHSYVMDGYGNARVVHYREGGKHPEIWGKPGSGPLEFSAPHTGLIDQKGRLIVCDRDNLRIQVLHPQTGELLETWTGFNPATRFQRERSAGVGQRGDWGRGVQDAAPDHRRSPGKPVCGRSRWAACAEIKASFRTSISH